MRLIAENNYQCNPDTMEVMFVTVENPVALFSLSPNNGCSPLPVIFTNNSTPTGISFEWNFGDGTTSSLISPIHVFTNSSQGLDSTYTIELVATSGVGCTDTIQDQVTIFALPVADFGYIPACMGKQTYFFDSSIAATQPITSWEWDFGNSNTSFIQNPINIYSSSGLYTTSLIVVNGNGCTDTIQKPVQVFPLPIVSYLHDTLVCIHDTVDFLNATIGASLYDWSFGNSLTSNLQNPKTTYNNSGNYPIKLIAETNNGCIDSASSLIHVIEPPVALFTPIPDSGCAPLLVLFQNQSTGYNNSYFWNFGNNQISALPNPAPVIYNQGMSDTVYYPTLIASNQCGIDNYDDSILVRPLPVAIFAVDRTYGCSPLVVNFSDNLTYGNPDTLIWDFGDGSPLIITTLPTSIQPIQHVFVTGLFDTTFTVTFIAKNSCGADTMKKQITIYPNTVDAFFSTDTLSGCVPLTVTFTNSSLGYTSSSWDFGDGTFSNQNSPIHTYQQPGNYNVMLAVTDSCASDTAYVNITVYPLPIVSFSSSDDTVCVNEIIQFTNTSPSPLASLFWDFGDGGSSNLNNPIHFYQSPGLYQVSLSGNSTNYDCPNIVFKNIIVLPTPMSVITSSTISGCPPLSVTFQGDSSFNSWDFGNGNTSNLNVVNQIYTTTGVYSVTLVSEYLNGCSDTSYIDITVFPSPISIFSQSIDSTCVIPVDVLFTNNSIGANGYLWNFGNGNSSTNNDSIIITFSNSGIFSNSLIASNQYNCSDTSYNDVLVYDAPIASASLSPPNGCQPLSVQFVNNSTSSNAYLWSFGDGGTSTILNPLYTYNNNGDYNVRLVSYGNANCSDTIVLSDTVEVFPKPTAIFTYNYIHTPVTNSGKIQMINSSILSDTYLWEFGDNSSDTAEEPIHRYNSYGVFNIILYVKNSFGCLDTAYNQVRISEFQGLYVSNAFSPDYGPSEVRTFKPRGVSLKTFNMYIYDNWGNLIWETDELVNGEPSVGWDGRDKGGNPMPQDTYVWKVEATFLNGSIWPGKTYDDGTTKRYGTVTLIR